MNRRCDRCEFWHQGSSKAGECRREPPKANSTWPVTWPEHWCGEFSPNEQAKAAERASDPLGQSLGAIMGYSRSSDPFSQL